MSRHLHHEIEKLKDKIVSLGRLAEQQVEVSLRAVSEKDFELAEKVIQGDRELDEKEVELEEDCLKILALHQPVAQDLRLVVAVLKINNDIERIGDLAVNIAKRARKLSEIEVTLPTDLQEMAGKTRAMLADSFLSFLELDSTRAREVLNADDEVDSLHKSMYGRTISQIKESPAQTDSQVMIMSISRCLERIADLASNIAEDVIYLMEGEIVRHGRSV